MEKAELEAVLRTDKKGSTRTKINGSGSVLAVVYGKGIDSMMIAVDLKKFEKAIGGKAGRNIIISLNISDGGKHKTVPVLTHEIQRNSMSGRIIHVDFLRINMEEAIKTKVRVELFGEPVGVKEHGGILVHGLREIEIKCLPGDIPGKFDVDVSNLKIGDALHVSNLTPPKGVEIISDPKETVVHISQPAKEEEVAPQAAVSAADVPSEKGAPQAAEGVPVAEGGKKAEKAPAQATAGGAPAKGAAAPAKGGAQSAPQPKAEEKKK